MLLLHASEFRAPNGHVSSTRLRYTASRAHPPPPKNVEPNWETHCSGDSYSVVVAVVVGVVVVVVVGEVVGVVTSQSWNAPFAYAVVMALNVATEASQSVASPTYSSNAHASVPSSPAGPRYSLTTWRGPA